ncbi:MAG: hypothetical protein ABI612_02200 [Betaproteobacteria bacterium]
MSLFWLKAVPWSTILSNAPTIVGGAKKLAALVRNQSDTAPVDLAARADSAVTDTASTIAMLERRVQALEQQQRETAELLRVLADNNAQMARAVEVLHRRAKLHFYIATATMLGMLALTGWLITH